MKSIIENRRKEEKHALFLDSSERQTETELRHKDALMEVELQMKQEEARHQVELHKLEIAIKKKELELIEAKVALAQAELER